MSETVIKIEEKTELTDELVEMLEEKTGLDIRELAKNAKMLKETLSNADYTDENSTKNKKPRSKPNEPVFEIALANYPDFCIKRTTAKTEQILAVMPSINSYYIKNMKDGTLTKLTDVEYGKFTAGMPDLKLPNDFWIKEVKSSATFWKNLAKSYLDNESVRDFIKMRLLDEEISTERLMSRSRHTRINRSLEGKIESYNENKILYREFGVKNNMNTNSYTLVTNMNRNVFIQDIYERFGLQNARDFLREIDISLVRVPYRGIGNKYRGYVDYRSNEISTKARYTPIPIYQMEYKAFKEYVLYQSVKMGYGTIIDRFFIDWNDTLDMQIKIYGKVKEKYPKDLPLMHQILSYKATILQETIDKNGFDCNSKKCQEYEGNVAGFRFMTPRTKEEMIDEAVQQANCLANYTKKYSEGNTMIYFMRKKDDLETSYITIEVIEVLNDLKLNQVFLAHNQKPGSKDMEIVNRWFKRICKKYNKKDDPNIAIFDEDINDEEELAS